MMLDVGLQLSVHQIKESAKRWKPLLVGLIQNVVVVPLLAYVVLVNSSEFFGLSAGVFAALVLTGVSPGAPIGPKMVQVGKGDLAYASILMLVCQLVSIFTAPLSAGFILSKSTGSDVSVAGVILILIAVLLVPLGVGMVLRKRFRAQVELLGKLAQASTGMLFLAAFITILATNIEVFTDIPFFEYGFMLVVTGLFAVVAIPSPAVNKDERISLVIMSGSRNFALAMVLASNGFGGKPALGGVLVLGALSTTAGFITAAVIGRSQSSSAPLPAP